MRLSPLEMQNQNNLIKLGHCILCKDLFAFDPKRVPTITDHAPHELMYPICRKCIYAINRRLLAGNQMPVIPLAGAYGEEDHS